MTRRTLTLADQLILSLGTLVVSIGAARTLDQDEFGIFGLAQIIVFLLIGTWQSGIGETVMVTASSETGQGQRRYIGQVMGAATLTASGLSILLILSVAVLIPSFLDLAFAAAASFIIISTQDAGRYGLASQGRSFFSLVGNASGLLVWITGALYLSLWQSQAPTGVQWFLLWAVGALASSLVLVLSQSGNREEDAAPARMRSSQWLRANWKKCLHYAGEFALVGAATQVSLVTMFGQIGVQGTAAIRGAQILFSPLNVALSSIRVVFLPGMVFKYRGGAKLSFRDRMKVIVLSGILPTALYVGSGILGPILLDDNWELSEAIIGPFAIQYFFLGWYWAILIFSRAIDAPRVSTITRGTLSLSTLAGVIGGALTLGLTGAVWGLAIAAFLSVSAGELAIATIRKSGSQS